MSRLSFLRELNAELDRIIRFGAGDDEKQGTGRTAKRVLMVGGGLGLAGIGVHGFRKLKRWTDKQPEWKGWAKEWEGAARKNPI